MKNKNVLLKYIKCAVIGVVTGLANGLFGSGGGDYSSTSNGANLRR